MMIGSCDLMGGKAVQLEQGDPNRCRHQRDNVEALVDDFALTGTVAVIDLDAALGRGSNRELIAKLCRQTTVHVGGGIRDKEIADFYLKAGARRLIIGTAANEEFLSNFHPDQTLVALDMKQGEVVDQGWTAGTGEDYLVRAKRLIPHCGGFLVTQVDREGLMGGFDMEPLQRLRELTDKPIIAAGGIASVDEIRELAKINVDCQLGMALYEGALDLKEAFVALGDWSKGLLPAVVQDSHGTVLMVGFINEEALKKTLSTRRATFWSRSRNELWTKGETSGNVMNVDQVTWDCDRDTVLIKVRPTGPACHFGSETCFGSGDESLFTTLFDDINIAASRSGWTKKLLDDSKLLAKKIREEGEEVADFTDRDNLVWEIGDLFYHVGVLMHREGIGLDEVRAELASRRKP